MINKEKNTYLQKGVSSAYQLEPGFKSLHTLIQHGYNLYGNCVCIQPGDKKSKKQQIEILFNDYRISSSVNFECLPLKKHLQCFSKALLYNIDEQIQSQSCYF